MTKLSREESSSSGAQSLQPQVDPDHRWFDVDWAKSFLLVRHDNAITREFERGDQCAGHSRTNMKFAIRHFFRKAG